MTKESKQQVFIEYYRAHPAATFQEVIKETNVISHSGFYKWKKDEEFMEQLHRDDERNKDIAEECIVKAMRNGDTKVAMWYLERKGGYHKVASEQNINVKHSAIAKIEVADMTEDKFASMGQAAIDFIPKDEEDVLALGKARFGEDFTFEMQDNG